MANIYRSVKNTGIFLKIAVIVLLLFLSIKLVGDGPQNYLSILHNLNLVFHEAGHTIFGLFGEFIGFMGGMLGQLLIPLILVVYFFFKDQLHSSLIMLWWFGENFLDLAPYIGDAQTQSITLIGGQHDFAYLLGRMDWLKYDLLFERWFTNLGALIMALSLALMTILVIRTIRESRIIMNES